MPTHWILTSIIASGLLVSPLHAATIQSLGIAPNNPLPGDVVTAYFQVDGSTAIGAAGVWIGGIQQCQAVAEHGYFSCAFSVPHGGRFNYELRFRDANDVLTASTQQALSGGLRIVKFQPEIVQAGRSAIIFAKLDYFHPAAVPQPLGQIQISSLDETHSCTIQLPQQTHCQILFTQAGRYPLRAQYSGDASYPALSSAVSEIRVDNPKLDHVIYANEVPLGPIVVGAFKQSFDFYPTKLNTYGNWRLSGSRGTTDYSVGAQISLFRPSPLLQSFFNPSTIFSALQNNTQTTTTTTKTTPRGEQSSSSVFGALRALSPTQTTLVETNSALVASDTNNGPDWYLKLNNSNTYYWLSQKADGSAIPGGLPNNGAARVLFNNDAIVFDSYENGIVADDQNGLSDVFVAHADRPTLRLPMPVNHASAASVMRINDASDQLLLYTSQALTADDQDSNTDTYLFNMNSMEYRRIFSFNVDGDVYPSFFAPNGAIVGHKRAANALIVQPLAGPRQELLLSPQAASFTLDAISSLGYALMSDARESQLSVNLNDGTQQLNFGRVVGDEALLQSQNVSLNESGSQVLTFNRDGLLALKSDGTARSALAAASVRTIRQDDDANFVAFSTDAALIPEDTNQTLDVYEWDQRKNQARRLSRRPDGTQTAQPSDLLAYSHNEGYALVLMQQTDLSVSNFGAHLARIDLHTGAVTALTGSVSNFRRLLSGSRNTRWAAIETDSGIARIDTQTGATLLLASFFGNTLPYIANAAISDDGQQLLVTRYSNNARSVYFLNLADASVRLIYQAEQDDNDVQVRVSANGQFALIGARRLIFCGFICPPIPPAPSKLFVLDLNRGLISESIASVSNNVFDFSGDASKIAWTSYNGGLTGSVTLRENPYFKLPSYTSIVRTVPSQPNLAQDFLVEAVVSHKETGLAPSGIVRFDDGNGAQCDGELIAQGELAIARCRILPNAHGLYTRLRSSGSSSATLALSLSASYLGDRRYGTSQGTRNINVSKVTPTFRWLVANPSIAPEVSIGIDLNALPDTAFTGSARISNFGTTCFLSAIEILAAKRCRFFIPNADSYAFTVTLDDPIYTLGQGSSMYLNVEAPGTFANGFE